MTKYLDGTQGMWKVPMGDTDKVDYRKFFTSIDCKYVTSGTRSETESCNVHNTFNEIRIVVWMFLDNNRNKMSTLLTL